MRFACLRFALFPCTTLLFSSYRFPLKYDVGNTKSQVVSQSCKQNANTTTVRVHAPRLSLINLMKKLMLRLLMDSLFCRLPKENMTIFKE